MPPTYTNEGLRAAREIRHTHPRVGTIVLSQYVDVDYALKLVTGSPPAERSSSPPSSASSSQRPQFAIRSPSSRRGRVHTQEAKIADLFALSISDDLFAHLERLASPAYGPYWVDPEMRYGLGPELNYLKMLGYIELGVDASVPDIREMPKGDNPELSNFVRVTHQGEAFIELRRQALRIRRSRLCRRKAGAPATCPGAEPSRAAKRQGLPWSLQCHTPVQ